MQSIPLKEVAPLQVHKLAPDRKDETFGYQRSFYDYVQSTDEVHGSLRTSLRNYLINREFADIPALSKQFIEISPEEVIASVQGCVCNCKDTNLKAIHNL